MLLDILLFFVNVDAYLGGAAVINHNSKEKIKRLFQFLKQYNSVKNPMITDMADQLWKRWLDHLPEYETVINNIYSSENFHDEIILKVSRPLLKECPKMPEELENWVENGWQNIDGEVKIIKELRYKIFKADNEESIYEIENFADDVKRISTLNQWKTEREQWVRNELPARAADELFNCLYELYSRIKKESESVELILGDGILLYKKETYIEHPIILKHVNLEFNADIPEFTLISAEKGTEVYRNIFYSIESANNELLKEVCSDFEKNNYLPVDIENINIFLNRVANALSARGTFVESIELLNNDLQQPQIYRKPVLFLRKRNLGFGIALDSVIEDINVNDSFPAFLEEIVGCIGEDRKLNENFTGLVNLNPNGIDEKILLTKPSNSEQLAVAKYLENNAAVLVQGPPGTGKTHTIANLIGHLLAEGKSILVTSSSEKALSVLKEKVEPNLQSLCLSLLSTSESRREMEKTLDEINENRSILSPITLNQQIEELADIRKKYITKLDSLRIKLKNARLSESRIIIVNGEEIKPIDAAKFIKEKEERFSWIPNPVKLGESMSVSEEEIIELYETNSLISKDEEKEYENRLPELNELINPTDLQRLMDSKNEFSIEELDKNKQYWSGSKGCSPSIEDLIDIKNSINSALEYIKLDKEWMLVTIEAGREETIKNSWLKLVNEINSVYKLSIELSEEKLKYNPEIKGIDSRVDIRKSLEAIINKLESKGKITRLNLMINTDMKSVINCCRVNGQNPKHINEYKALLKYYDLITARKQLENRWNRQIAVLGADNTNQMSEDFEIVCKKYCSIILDNLLWYQKYWNPIMLKLKNLGIDIEALESHADISSDKYGVIKNIKKSIGIKLIEAIDAEIYRVKYYQIVDRITCNISIVAGYLMGQNSYILSGLQEALIEEDISVYKKSYEALVRIKSLSKLIERRRYLIEKLSKDAPTWAKEIQNRNSIHGEGKPPTSIREAWLFVQLDAELKKRNLESIEAIQDEIVKVENYLKENTVELAFKKAWKAMLEKFQGNKKQVQAIEGWRQLVRKIGNGKGKQVEAYRAEARKLIPFCQNAVPVWIMPLSKVVENFNPVENKFDVVIIDEASQADVMGLAALYLGKKAIIVGDNQQVSPLSIGERAEDVGKLIGEYLYDIPNDKLYSGKFSIYDLAQTSGYQPIRLREHFRCVPEIIQYSNLLSYNGQIRPLRDDSEVTTKPALVTYMVENAVSKNKVNEKEAEVIVSLILACCKKAEYNNKTFGVITLRGDKQAVLIDRLLQKKMEPAEYRRRAILCGNSANFQGDERDIVFLSMVDANDKAEPMRLNGYGNDELFKKRYNVAVSRAKDQIWLVHSIDADNDLKPGDIRKELLEYFKNPHAKSIDYEMISKKAESEFEKEVGAYLINKGYKIIPQWKVGSYRIDMVAVYKDKKVAIECDGEKWHTEDKFEEDMIRQAILERLGWKFIRIRGSEFYRNKIETINVVSSKLEKMEIYPYNEYDVEEDSSKNLLIDSIKAIAADIRRQW